MTTFQDGEILTAALINQNLNHTLITSKTYTPAFTSSGTNPTGHTVVGSYVEIGKLISFSASVTLASSGYGSGSVYYLELPVLPHPDGKWSGTGIFRDTSASASYPLTWEQLTPPGQVVLRLDPTTAGAAYRSLTSGSPVTWANGDVIGIRGTYIAQ